MNKSSSVINKYLGKYYDAPNNTQSRQGDDNIERNSSPISLPKTDSKIKEKSDPKLVKLSSDLGLSEEYLKKYNQLTSTYRLLGNWGNKVSSIVSAVVMGESFSSTTRVPPHFINQLSALSAVRASIQNNLNTPLGLSKQNLIDELLYMANLALINTKKIVRLSSTTLPGSSFVGHKPILNQWADAKTGMIEGLINASQTTVSSPSNRPSSPSGDNFKEKLGKFIGNPNTKPGIEPHEYGITTKDAFSLASLTSVKGLKNLFSKDKKHAGGIYNRGIVNVGKFNFHDKYINNPAMKQTLSELALGESKIESIKNLNDLNDLIRNTNNYMTTYDKLKNLDQGFTGKWELILEPYAGPLNGNFTFLPSLHEINLHNKLRFGIDTGYSKWFPATSFEVQTRKTTHKSIPLFDGDFTIPVSMELTNELRISIADDTCRSFWTYFKKCAECSTYRSFLLTPFEFDQLDKPSAFNDNHRSRSLDNLNDIGAFGYNEDTLSKIDYALTSVDRNKIEVAMYKNIVFRCSIFILKDDLATVYKHEMLVLMKDFQIFSSGDTDITNADVEVNFSIVGDLNQYGSEGAKEIVLGPKKTVLSNLLDNRQSEQSAKIEKSLEDKRAENAEKLANKTTEGNTEVNNNKINYNPNRKG